MSTPNWFVYILRCRDGTYYTGITTDLTRRLTEHNAGLGAKYTRPRRPIALVYSEPTISRSAAARREYQIKRLTPAGKKKLIEDNPAAPADNSIFLLEASPAESRSGK